MATSMNSTYVGYTGDLSIYFEWSATKKSLTESYLTAKATLLNDDDSSHGSWIMLSVGGDSDDAGHSTLAVGATKTAQVDTVISHSAAGASASFSMWCEAMCDNANTKQITKTYTIDGWTASTYTVSYSQNGYSFTNFPSASTKTEGVNLSLPQPGGYSTNSDSNFTITGNANGGKANTSLSATKRITTSYSFTGWNTSPNGYGTSYSTAYGTDSSATLYAQGSSSQSTSYLNNTLASLSKPTYPDENITYTISYIDNGGNIDKISDSATRTIKRSFSNWANESGSPYTDSSAFTSDTTVYAQWTITSDTTESISLPTATKTGYSFRGWSESPSSTQTVPNIYTPDNNVTLYAIYDAGNVSYKVNHYIKNIGSDTYTLDSTDTISGTADSSITLSTLSKTITGFTYSIGKANGSETTTTTISADGSRVIDLYYTRNMYNVTLNRGSGISSVGFIDGIQTVSSITESFEYGSSISITAVPMEGYGFKGWSGDLTSNNRDFTFNIPNKNLSLTATGGIITYTIKFNGNGHTSGSTQSMEMTYGVASNLTANGFTKTGYTFKNWNDKADGSGISYNDKQYVNNLTDITESIVTLYAIWEPNTNTKYIINHYTQDINSDNYSLDNNNIESKTGSSDSVLILYELRNATLQGFTYKEGKVNNSIVTETTISADGSRVIDLYYTRNKYNVSLTFDDGIISVNGSGTYEYNSEITISAIVKTGYNWSKWITDTNTYPANPYTFNLSSGNIEFSATTALNTYTIVFDGNGNTDGSTENMVVTYGIGKNLNVNGYIKTGYEFVEWNTEPDGSGISYHDTEYIINLSTEANDIIKLYAIWRSLGLVYLYNEETSEYDAYQMFIADDNNNWDLYVPYIGTDENSWDLY